MAMNGQRDRKPGRSRAELVLAALSLIVLGGLNYFQLQTSNRNAEIYNFQLTEMRKSNTNLTDQNRIATEQLEIQKRAANDERSARAEDKIAAKREIDALRQKIEDERGKFRNSYNTFSGELQRSIDESNIEATANDPEKLKIIADQINEHRTAIRLKMRELQGDLEGVYHLLNSDMDDAQREALTRPIDTKALKDALKRIRTRWPEKSESIYRLGDKVLKTLGCAPTS